MNYNKNNGWYYSNLNNRSASWSGVNEFYNFLVSNKLNGPRGDIVEQKDLRVGNIIQLSFNGTEFAHTLIIVDIENIEALDKIYTASHTFDSYKRKVSSYNFQKIRFIHINGVISVKKFRMKILEIIIDTINRYSKLRDFSLSFVLS